MTYFPAKRKYHEKWYGRRPLLKDGGWRRRLRWTLAGRRHRSAKGQDRSATGRAGPASHAPATREVPYRPDQRPARTAGRIWRSHAAGQGRLRKGIPEALQRLSDRLPAIVIDTLREQWHRIARLDDQVGDIERQLKQWHKTDDASRRIAAIPGVGLLTATAAVAR